MNNSTHTKSDRLYRLEIAVDDLGANLDRLEAAVERLKPALGRITSGEVVA